MSLDLYAGVRLWRGAEAHVDGLMWQGFGLSKTLGVEGFPNGEAFRLGTEVPNVNLARLFIRQTIGLGGEQETGRGRPAATGRQGRTCRGVTLTLGKISAKDIFDNNAYANDPRTQFMNWALVANEAWDYPADSIGYETGFAAELNQPHWTARYGFFQMPRTSNGTAQDTHYLEAWGMVTEFERRYTVNGHPGAVRFLAYLNSADMGSYQDAINSPIRPADIVATRAYRYKYGFGLNVEQEIIKNVGAFARLGLERWPERSLGVRRRGPNSDTGPEHQRRVLGPHERHGRPGGNHQRHFARAPGVSRGRGHGHSRRGREPGLWLGEDSGNLLRL